MIEPTRICNSRIAGDHEKVFADPALARGQGREPRQHRVHRRLVGIVQIALIDEQHGAEGEEREAEADPGPPEGAGGRRVADQRLERPILRPRRSRSRPPRDRRQRRIDQEIGGLRGALLIKAVGLGPALGEIVMQQRLDDLGRAASVIAAARAVGNDRDLPWSDRRPEARPASPP